jgi:Fur family ferric uptake transcriptional regulator
VTERDIGLLLRERGITATAQRRLIARILFSATSHMAAGELHERAHAVEPRIGLATVYRALDLFTRKGLIAARDFGEGWRRYEESGDGHHDHLICMRCGKVVEFDVPEIEALQERVARDNGFTPVGHRMDLFGRCKACGERAK